jgi:ABC-2 type transport system permease protein
MLGLSVVLTSAGRTVPEGEWIGRLSPLYYFELNKPLLPNYAANTGAMLLLASLACGLTASGVALFIYRDVGAPAALPANRPDSERRRRALPELRMNAWPVWPAWSLRSVFSRSLGALRGSALWWGLAMAVYAALLTAILRQAQQNLAGLLESLAKQAPMYAGLIARFMMGGDIASNASLLSFVFTLLAAAVAAFGVTLANRWAADEEEGRLELLLSTPKSRPLVILARFAASAVALLIVASMVFAAVALSAAAAGMSLDRSRLAQATFGMAPVGLAMVALGFLLSGWLRAMTVTGVLIAFLLGSFVITLLGPLFKWPDFLLQLSIFEQYGAPLLTGLRVTNTLALIGVATAALLIATLRFARKDLAG